MNDVGLLFVFETDGRDFVFQDDFGFDGLVVVVPDHGFVRGKVREHALF